MCGRYKLVTPSGKIIEEFSATGPRLNLRARFNIAPTQEAPVIRLGPTGRQLHMIRWGLIPAWAQDSKMAYSMINSRAETIATRPAFRDALSARRCLVVADGFYEWKTVGKVKHPYLFQLPDGALLAFAGLFECWMKGERPLETFTIICGPATGVVASIHDRMPVILPREHWEQWLNAAKYNGEAVLPLLKTPADPGLVMGPVSRRLNSVANDDVGVLEPDGPPEQPLLL